MSVVNLKAVKDPDEQWFTDHPMRTAHIRLPTKVLMKNKQRHVGYLDEAQGEFWSLGDHDKERRRILLWRVPLGHPLFNPAKMQVLKIPFLLFSDESVEDSDAVLLPIIDQIMREAAG